MTSEGRGIGHRLSPAGRVRVGGGKGLEGRSGNKGRTSEDGSTTRGGEEMGEGREKDWGVGGGTGRQVESSVDIAKGRGEYGVGRR